MDPRKRFFVVALLFLFLIPLAGCPNNDNNNNSLTPSTQGVGVALVKSFTEVTGFAVQLIDKINEEAAAAVPTSAKAAVQPRTIPSSISCDSGTVDIDSSGLPTSYTLTAHDCVFDGGSLVINEGTTAVVTGDFTKFCSLDPNSPAPPNFSVVLNGSISLDGTDFNLTALNINLTNVVYDQGTGCGIDMFNGTFNGGVKNGATINFTTLAFGVALNVADYTLDIYNGSMTVDTPCDNNTYNLATLATLHITFDASCPVEGILDVTKVSDGSVVEIDFTSTPEACSAQACQVG